MFSPINSVKKWWDSPLRKGPLRLENPNAGKFPEQKPLRPQIFPDNNRVLSTLFAEASGEPEDGMRAAFDVVRNRANKKSIPWDAVVSEKGQFEAFGNPAYERAFAHANGQNTLSGQDLRSYNRLRAIMEENGPDTINGATLYLNPKMQVAQGRKIPSWAADPKYLVAEKGNHQFFLDR